MSLAALLAMAGIIIQHLHYDGIMIVAEIPLVKFTNLTKVTLRMLITD